MWNTFSGGSKAPTSCPPSLIPQARPLRAAALIVIPPTRTRSLTAAESSPEMTAPGPALPPTRLHLWWVFAIRAASAGTVANSRSVSHAEMRVAEGEDVKQGKSRPAGCVQPGGNRLSFLANERSIEQTRARRQSVWLRVLTLPQFRNNGAEICS